MQPFANIDTASIAEHLPADPTQWGYLAGCALFFVLVGLGAGYFIWRKGNMQMQDAEIEVKKTAEELEELQQNLITEEQKIDEASQEA